MKLYELKKQMPIKLLVTTDDGVEHPATCHHLDGAYSYCTVDDMDTGNIFHLSASTPMTLAGVHYLICTDEDVKPMDDENPNTTTLTTPRPHIDWV